MLCTPSATVSRALCAPPPTASLTVSRRRPPFDERFERDLRLDGDAVLRRADALRGLVEPELRALEALLPPEARFPRLEAAVFRVDPLLDFERELDEVRPLAFEPDADFFRAREVLWAIPTSPLLIPLVEPGYPDLEA
jgi:hypothetical protein